MLNSGRISVGSSGNVTNISDYLGDRSALANSRLVTQSQLDSQNEAIRVSMNLDRGRGQSFSVEAQPALASETEVTDSRTMPDDPNDLKIALSEARTDTKFAELIGRMEKGFAEMRGDSREGFAGINARLSALETQTLEAKSATRNWGLGLVAVIVASALGVAAVTVSMQGNLVSAFSTGMSAASASSHSDSAPTK